MGEYETVLEKLDEILGILKKSRPHESESIADADIRDHLGL